MAISKLNFNSLNVTPTASKGIGFDSGADDLDATLSGGSMVFIKKLTASSSGTLTFHHGTSDVILDSTFKEYVFMLNNIHGSAVAKISFQANTVGASGFNENITSTAFGAYHEEGDSGTTLEYEGGLDQAQGTAFQSLCALGGINTGNDSSGSGYLHLFNLSSTTFVKHFTSRFGFVGGGDYQTDAHIAGYCNTTAAIDGVQFKMSSGNIDAGDITLYGIT